MYVDFLIWVKGVNYSFYIFCMIVDKIWVSDDENFILMNIIGDILNWYGNFFNNFLFGFYIVNKDGELIFIDYNYNIKKLLNDMKIINIFIDVIYFIVYLCCLYWFFYLDDLIVGWNELFLCYIKKIVYFIW